MISPDYPHCATDVIITQGVSSDEGFKQTTYTLTKPLPLAPGHGVGGQGRSDDRAPSSVSARNAKITIDVTPSALVLDLT